MKKTSTLLILLVSVNVFAQNYHPMLDTNNQWTFVINMLAIGPENQACSYPFYPSPINGFLKTGEDTLINGMTYKILDQDSFCRYGYMREDTGSKKIYFMANNFAPEILEYDFGMQLNDSIEISFDQNGFSSYWQDGYYTLDSIQPLAMHQGSRMGYYLNCHTCANNHTLEWIEGIGNRVNPVYTHCVNDLSGGLFSMCPEYQNSFPFFMICFQHNDIEYFDSCAYSNAWIITDSCHYYIPSSGINEITFAPLVSVTQNPFSSHTELIFDDGLDNPVLKIYDIRGKMMINEIVQEKTFRLNRNSFPAGVYMYCVIDAKGKSANGKLIAG